MFYVIMIQHIRVTSRFRLVARRNLDVTNHYGKILSHHPNLLRFGKPHIGHAFAVIFADVLARRQKSKGKDVFFRRA